MHSYSRRLLYVGIPSSAPHTDATPVLQFYGPAHIIRPEVLSAEEGAIVLQQYFRYALQNSLMFEALIALAQANLTVHQWVDGPDKDALFHYSRSLQRLREVISEQDGYTQDSVLFAIIALMGVDVSVFLCDKPRPNAD